MSSAAHITFEKDTKGVPADEWAAFCVEHEIAYSPNTVGGNVYYYGGKVEIHYEMHGLTFSTFWMGPGMNSVARIAIDAWRRWGGTLSADPEIRDLTRAT